MSKIDKLQIVGIRSFDHNQQMAIQFKAPLTLIVGTNGSGKTTIIECLKYATTGELPPNTKVGGAFIHDPALTGEKEVLAQVKVQFSSIEKVRMVATRSLQLTVKKNARSMKQLESSIRMLKDGERNVLSSRTAEINSLIPRYLGVSKAVLENVIFCHQEDSLWPLSAPKDLKEKFDAIFEAQKYTKAIDNIRILQKNKKLELIQHQGTENHMKADHEKARKLEKTIDSLNAQLEQLKREMKDFTWQKNEAHRNAEEAYAKASTAGEVVGKLIGKRISRDTKEENIESIRANLTEMEDSDEDLASMLAAHEDRIRLFDVDLAQQRSNYQDLGDEIQSVRDGLSAKERELGSHEARKEANVRQMEGRKKLIQEAARTHEIRGYEYDIDNSQAKQFIERLNRLARDKQAEFDQARSDLQDELQRQQRILNRISEKKSAYKQSKETARQAIASNDRKIGDFQSRQNNLDVDEGGKVALESQLSDTKNHLATAKAEFASASWDEDIAMADVELRRLEDRREMFEVELVEATRRAGDTAQLDYLQKERSERQRSLETMMNAHGDNISKTLIESWTPASLEKVFQRTLNQSVTKLGEAERQRNGVSGESEYQHAKIQEVEKQLESAQAELKVAEKSVLDVLPDGCPTQQYPEEVEKLETDRDGLRASTEEVKLVRDYFEKCIKAAREHNACRTCTRPFKKPEQQERAIKTMNDLLQQYNIDDRAPQTLQEIEEDLKRAKAASSAFDTWKRLRGSVIPERRDTLKRFQKERDHLQTELEKRDNVVRDMKQAKSDVESLTKTVHNIVKYYSDIASFDVQIEELREEQEFSGLSRGLEAIQTDKRHVDGEAKAITAKKAEATSSRDKLKSRISALELQVSNTQGKVAATDWQLKQKRELQAQEEEYRRLNIDQRNEIAAADQALEGLTSDESTEQARYDDISRRGADRDRNLQDQASKLGTSVNKLRLADQEIQAYGDSGGEQPLHHCRSEIEASAVKLSQKQQDQLELTKEINELKKQMANHDEVKRSIIDNQRFRRDVRQLEDLHREIAELETHNAEADKQRYDKEGVQWQQRRNHAAAQEASLAGHIKSLDDQLDQANQDWETDYKDTSRKHTEAHIMVITTKAAIEDLGRYAGALDKAIMKYHSLKMEEINRSIDELWRKTYQGTDVDTIMIRSENETVKANKTYNYRVCMMKQDTEMDMRGRCSAGQKVLASIIIRLALAECFGINCGLIALDEPTTNLDRDNIKALAESLAEIIRLRRAQHNFQLIIITHDEDFLSAMGGSQFTDDYYRVFRDHRQNSCIEKQNIGNIM